MSSLTPQFKSISSSVFSLCYVQLSHPYMTIGKTIALDTCTFVGKVMSLLFKMLSRLVITLLPRSKRLLISWLQSPSAVILECKKIKYLTVSIVSVRQVYVSRFLSRHNNDLERRTLKPSAHHSSWVLNKPCRSS